MQIEYIKLCDLQEYKNNPRNNEKAIEAVAESIASFGFKVPIVADENKVIIAGHTRYKAAELLGLHEVPCIIASDLTPEKIQAYRLADNKTAELAEWDFEKLEKELAELTAFDIDMSAFGFDESLFNFEIKEPQEVIEDEIPEVDNENEPITKLGDIWQLGKHRLICGDSTDKATITRLLNGNKAHLVFTDPPYNVAFNGRSGNFEVIKNDNIPEAEFNSFINEVCEIIKYINPANYYIWCNWKFYSILQTKLSFKACIVWAKNNLGLGNGYRHQHEFCLFNGRIDEKIKNESDLWEIAKDSNYLHPTQKPVALCARALKNHSEAINIIDLFGGSGSTLVACEQLNRICYMCELDPKYCDVIIKRWETFTGKKAELVTNALVATS